MPELDFKLRNLTIFAKNCHYRPCSFVFSHEPFAFFNKSHKNEKNLAVYLLNIIFKFRPKKKKILAMKPTKRSITAKR